MNILVEFLSYNFNDFNGIFLDNFSIICIFIPLNVKPKGTPNSEVCLGKGPTFQAALEYFKRKHSLLLYYVLTLLLKSGSSSALISGMCVPSVRERELIILNACFALSLSTCLTKVLRIVLSNSGRKTDSLVTEIKHRN